MNALLIFIVCMVILACGYLFYSKWLAKVWGVDDSRPTPAHEYEDGVDYEPAKAPVLLGHHFSSIAGAGPINGPIQAAVFGWVPVILWVLIGGIFFGAVHDFGALFASIRHKGQSIGEVIRDTMGMRMKRLFIVFAYLTLLLVVAAFASIVASTFEATYTDSGAVDKVASAANATTAMISILFIFIAIVFGFLIYRRHTSLLGTTLAGIVAIVIIIAIGYNWHPIYLGNTAWMILLGVYIMIASIVPVWILLQPRDYLSSFLLYFMIIVAIIGIIGAHPGINMPAFTGWYDTIAPTGTSLGFLFPALFVTIACGAISGFHSLVASGTTAKQLDREGQARPIGYGAMIIECVVAVVSTIAVGYIWASYKSGDIVVPTQVFASGISKMVATIPFLAGAENLCYTMLVLAVSVFCLTSLDTATRLARYLFQEFWLEEGETVKSVKEGNVGWKKVLTNPYLATVITVVLGIALGLTGYAKIWPMFGAANQLLAALGLLAVATWLGKIQKNNKMFFFPMAFMLVVTITSLCFTIKNKILLLITGGPETGWSIALLALAVVLIVLAVVLAVDGIKTLFGQAREKKNRAEA